MLIPNIYLLVCAVFGLGYGLYIMLTQKPPAYFKLVLFSMASQVFARIYYTVSIVCYGGIPDTFNLGFIGFASFLLFLFFANYGQIDMLVDDRRNLITKYRIIPVIIPVVELVVALLSILADNVELTVTIPYVILSIIAGLAGYLNMKHFIIPDVEDGIVRAIRGYNLVAIFVEILTLAEIGLICFDASQLVIFVQIALGILFVVMMPLLNKEVRKWTII